MLFNSMIGQKIKQEIDSDARAEADVTTQTHAMEKVRLVSV